MRILLIAAVLATGLQSTSSQAKPTRLVLSSDWEVGKAYHYERVKERVVNGKSGIKGRTRVEVKVLEGNKDGYLIQWAFGETEILGNPPEKTAARQVANLLKGIKFKIRTDPYGRAKSLVDKGVVLELTQAAGKAVVRSLKARGLWSKDKNRHLEDIELFLDDANFERALLKEPTIFFTPSGGTYDLKKKQCYRDQIPNPFDGDPFPVQAWFYLDSYRSETNRASLKWEYILDAHRARSILRKTVKQMARRKGVKGPSEKDLPRFSWKERAAYVYDTETGFPVSVRYTGKYRIKKKTQIDRLTYTRVAD